MSKYTRQDIGLARNKYIREKVGKPLIEEIKKDG